MADIKEYIQAVVTILALINPLVCMELFGNSVQGLPRRQRIGEALKALTAIGVVLFASAFFGMTVLKTFGISISAFSCAGGGILVWIGAGMLTPKDGDAKRAGRDPAQEVSLTPLILFAASPGTITGIITIVAAHNKKFLPVTALTGVAVSLLVLAAALLSGAMLSKGSGRRSGVQKIVSSYMGVLIIAMGIQFVLIGVRNFK